MPLPAGQVYTAGTIVGRHHDRFREIPGQSRGLTPQLLFGPVIQTLCDRHAFSRCVDYTSYKESGFFSLDRESPAIQGDANGTILRVFHGCGALKVNGSTPRSRFGLDYGDWIYIPPCVSITLTGAAVSGMSLQFSTVRLLPKRQKK